MNPAHTFAANELVTAANLNTLGGWYTSLPRLRLNNTGALTAVATATPTTVTFTVADILDTDTMHSTSTNPTRITINTAGFYLFSARVAWGTATTGTYRGCRLYKNGALLVGQNSSPAGMGTNASGGTYQYNFIDYAAAADYFEVNLSQDTGGSISPVVIVDVMWQGAP